MQFGISTASFYPAKTEEAAAMLAAHHVPAVEIFLNSFSELKLPYLREMKKILDDGGTKVLSVHPFTCALEPMLFFGTYDRRLEDGLDLYRHFFEAGALLGAKYFILHGDHPHNHTDSEEFYIERFLKMDETAREFGLRVAQENVCRCRSRSLPLLRKMKEKIPDFCVTFDLKQARRSGVDWREFLNVMGNSVRHIHMSGCSPEADCQLVGKSGFECAEFFSALHQMGYEGGILLELYRQNYGEYEELFEDLAFMQNLDAELCSHLKMR